MKANLQTVVKSLPEQIAESIAASVIRGELAPGEGIREQVVADAFGVSRSSVREALRILDRDGVVVIRPRHGASVTKLSTAEMVEIYQIRRVLFGLAAAQFAALRSSADMATLRQTHREMKALAPASEDEHASEHARLSAEMARRIIDGSGNRKLAQLLYQMSLQISRYTILGLSSPERRQQSAQNWTRVLSALDKQDAEAAELGARKLIEDTLQFALRRLG